MLVASEKAYMEPTKTVTGTTADTLNEYLSSVISTTVNGAGDGIRTRGLNLGKVVLCQLSYPRTELHLLITQPRTDIIR